MPTKQRRPRRNSVELHIRHEKETPTVVRAPFDLDPHTMVLAAWGRFLPHGTLPSRIMRGNRQLAIYNPLAHIREDLVRDGDVLVCEHDRGQQLDGPSMLRAYRVLHEYAAGAASQSRDFGHVGVA